MSKRDTLKDKIKDKFKEAGIGLIFFLSLIEGEPLPQNVFDNHENVNAIMKTIRENELTMTYTIENHSQDKANAENHVQDVLSKKDVTLNVRDKHGLLIWSGKCDKRILDRLDAVEESKYKNKAQDLMRERLATINGELCVEKYHEAREEGEEEKTISFRKISVEAARQGIHNFSIKDLLAFVNLFGKESVGNDSFIDESKICNIIDTKNGRVISGNSKQIEGYIVCNELNVNPEVAAKLLNMDKNDDIFKNVNEDARKKEIDELIDKANGMFERYITYADLLQTNQDNKRAMNADLNEKRKQVEESFKIIKKVSEERDNYYDVLRVFNARKFKAPEEHYKTEPENFRMIKEKEGAVKVDSTKFEKLNKEEIEASIRESVREMLEVKNIDISKYDDLGDISEIYHRSKNEDIEEILKDIDERNEEENHDINEVGEKLYKNEKEKYADVGNAYAQIAEIMKEIQERYKAARGYEREAENLDNKTLEMIVGLMNDIEIGKQAYETIKESLAQKVSLEKAIDELAKIEGEIAEEEPTGQADGPEVDEVEAV